MRERKLLEQVFGLMLVVLILAGCGGAGATPTATSTPIPPTSTPVPPTPTVPSTTTPPLLSISYTPDKHLDVFLPKEADKPFPTLLLLHGSTQNSYSLRSMAAYFTERGYATVLPNWEESPPAPSRHVSNAFCALAWIHANAETYGFDPERTVAFGHSSGGRLAALLGVVEDPTELMGGCPQQLPASGWTQAIVTYGGVFNTPVLIRKDYLARAGWYASLLGVPVDEWTEQLNTIADTPPQSWRDITGLSELGILFVKSSPPYWIDGSEPPFLLIHGEDEVIDSAEPEAFEALLQAAGVDAKLLMLPNASHQDVMRRSSSGFEPACQAMEAFLAKVLE